MLRLLRRCRIPALTLLLAAPGLGGTWLSVAHPCPVDLPWLAPAGHAEHGAEGARGTHAHGGAPAEAPSTCNCVGACQGGSAALISLPAGPVALVAPGGWNSSASAPHLEAPLQLRPHRQPPATAPPLA